MGLILPQNVEVKNSVNNKKRYIALGYHVDLNSDSIIINVLDLPYRSKTEVEIKCDYCNKNEKIMYRDYFRAQKGIVVDKIACYDHRCKIEKHKEVVRSNSAKANNVVSTSYRNKDWLFNEYINKNRTAEDISIECNVNLRTIRDWLNRCDLIVKNDNSIVDIAKEELYELYVTQQKSTIYIANLYGVCDRTVVKLLRKYNINIYDRSYLTKRYLYSQGGFEKLIEHSNSEEYRIKRSCILRGISIEDFNGFVLSENQLIRSSYKYSQWRKSVFERDSYTCQCCGKTGGELNAHHIRNFSDNKDLRFDINNGITLCKECHHPNIWGSFHSIYGKKHNTEKQLNEYINSKNA